MKLIAVTNNSLITQNMANKDIFEQILFSGCSFEDVLKISASMVKNGHKLMMCPLLGNIPPYEMPFKTIILSESASVIDFGSLNAISAAARITEQALSERTRALWIKTDLDEFKKIDLLVIERWLTKVYLPMRRKEAERRSES